MPTPKKKSATRTVDADLSDPRHDEILLWLNDRSELLAQSILDLPPAARPAWNPDQLATFTRRADQAVLNAQREYTTRTDLLRQIVEWTGLIVPLTPTARIETEWQAPVAAGRAKRFVDIRVRVQHGYLVLRHVSDDGRLMRTGTAVASHEPFAPPTLECIPVTDELHFYVEVAIESLGALVRQIKGCAVYGQSNIRPYIVSPDARFVTQLTAQGIGFVTYPDGAVHRPQRNETTR